MKRNLMLLTAVVLVAVMLSGCALWPFGKVKVNWTGDAKEVFVKKDMVKRVKKNETTTLEVKFLDGINNEDVTTDPASTVLENDDGEVIGRIFALEVKDEDITITVTLGGEGNSDEE